MSNMLVTNTRNSSSGYMDILHCFTVLRCVKYKTSKDIQNG